MDISSSKTKVMIDLRQSKNYAKYLKTQGWRVERIDNTNYFLRKVPIFGYILKIQRPHKINFKQIEKLQKKYKVFQTIIEPNLTSVIHSSSYHNLFISRKYKLNKSPYLPSKTIHIDLTKSMKAITADMDKRTRYSVRRGEGVKIRTVSSLKNLENFYKAWKKSVPFNRYVPSFKSLKNLVRAFTTSNSLVLTSHNIYDEIIGGAIFTTSSHERTNYITYYMYGFTNKEGRSSLSQYSLLYHGILWGKEKGCKIFDMEGIYDSRFPNKSWLGFSHFKKGFGGKVVSYPGAYTKFYLSNIFRRFR